MRALIDTCIIMDAVQNREPFANDAKTIFRAAAGKLFTGCITAKSSTDIYYLTHRCTHSDKDSRAILTKLYILFDVIDTASMDVRRAISSNISDYKDAVMIETAIREDIDCIVTRNAKDYTASTVPVYSPAEFLKLFDGTVAQRKANSELHYKDDIT
jgi:predicted nucleic acid-binding protein